MTHNEANPTQETENQTFGLLLEVESIRSNLCYATVIVAASIVDTLYHEAALSQQRSAQTHGFGRGEVPLIYIKQNFKEHLIEHLKELLFKYCVVNFLYKETRTRKLLVAGEPRLHDIKLEPGQDAQFIFELTIFPELSIYEWRYFPFKAPKRKNYKDLDRQVETFIQEERDQLSALKNLDDLLVNDWVNFSLIIMDKDQKPLLNNFAQYFWFKLGHEETESPLRNEFLGRKKGDIFFCTNHALQEYFSEQIDTDYNFRIEVLDTLSHKFFCFEQLKKHFRIKTNKDMHKKLIEIFSFRNDISQRRAMVEESLKLLLSKHRFTVPNHLILRQQKILLDIIRHNPDYNVYRMQKSFQKHIQQLAEKQAKETIFIDKLAYNENISIVDQDIKSYLNLMNRRRTKEFIYFDLPSFRVQGQEVPIPIEEIKRTCLREKTINYVIYYLTKK